MDCSFVQMLGPCSTGTVLYALYASHYSCVVCRTFNGSQIYFTCVVCTLVVSVTVFAGEIYLCVPGACSVMDLVNSGVNLVWQ